MRGTYYNPISFYIAPSLTLDLNNPTSIKNTASSQITFTLLVNESTGQFVKQAVEGVIIYYTDAQKQVKLEGLKDNVNSVINKMLYFSLLANATKKKVSVTVEDGVNNNIVQTFIIDQLSFISLNVPTTKGIDLQPQFNSQFSAGNAAIEADVSISFSKESFIGPDTSFKLFYASQLTRCLYSCFFRFFFQVSNTDLKVSGKTTDSQYGNTYYFRIRTSDGQSEAFNYFSISVSLLPFSFFQIC
ncbi:hypothetical protein ABPG72_007410 [Tetrahymena utriculariae]